MIEKIKGLPSWALWGGGAVVAYLAWRAISDPEKLGAAAGAGAVSAVSGVVQGVGAGVKGAIDGAVQSASGDKTKTLGTAIYDFFHTDEGKSISEPVKQKTDVKELDAWLSATQAPLGGNGNPVYAGATPGGDSFWDTVKKY